MLNEGIVITNEDQRILFVNSRFVEMDWYPPTRHAGRPTLRSSTPKQEWEFSGSTDCCRATSRPPTVMSFYFPQKDGGRLPVYNQLAYPAEFRRRVSEIITRLRHFRGRRVSRRNCARLTRKLQERQLEIEEDLRPRRTGPDQPRTEIHGRVAMSRSTPFYHPVAFNWAATSRS